MEKKDYNVKDVITRVIEETNMTVKAFAEHMGISYDRIFALYRGRTRSIQRDIIDAITKTYKVNSHYLLTGEGAIFDIQSDLSEEDTFARAAEMYSKMRTAYKKAVSDIELLNAKIALLEKENEVLKQRNSELENELASRG